MNIFKLLPWNRKPVSPEKYSGEGTVLISFVSKLDKVIATYSPEQMVEFLKKHLAVQSKIIESHSGFVLSFVGDSILAFWPDDEAQHNSGLKAFQAAQKMVSSADKVIDYQIVLSTGLLVGDFFGPIKQYQVVGVAKDVAEQLCKFRYPVHRVILLTESTKAQLDNLNLSFQVIGQLKNGNNILACIN